VHPYPALAPAFIPYKPGKWLANLYELARLKLQFFGITQVFGGDYCTYTQKELFFSYRRDQKNTGRMASLIWISAD
jgi:copper oxidase (laccase) domain-containing protein